MGLLTDMVKCKFFVIMTFKSLPLTKLEYKGPNVILQFKYLIFARHHRELNQTIKETKLYT